MAMHNLLHILLFTVWIRLYLALVAFVQGAPLYNLKHMLYTKHKVNRLYSCEHTSSYFHFFGTNRDNQRYRRPERECTHARAVCPYYTWNLVIHTVTINKSTLDAYQKQDVLIFFTLGKGVKFFRMGLKKIYSSNLLM